MLCTSARKVIINNIFISLVKIKTLCSRRVFFAVRHSERIRGAIASHCNAKVNSFYCPLISRRAMFGRPLAWDNMAVALPARI